MFKGGNEGASELGLCDKKTDPRRFGFLFDFRSFVGDHNNDGGLLADDLSDTAHGLHAIHLRHLPVYENDIVALLSVHLALTRSIASWSPVTHSAFMPIC